MDKIEKMSGYSEVTMKLKINEIIDYLNQSQKQPEGEYKCGTLEVLKNPKLRKELSQTREWNDECGNHHIEKVDSNGVTKTVIPNEPEKQEEWRKRITWEDGEYFMIDGKEANEEDLRDFISQLLSESKEKAEAFDELHDILKPYHKEAEDYTDTLKRVLSERIFTKEKLNYLATGLQVYYEDMERELLFKKTSSLRFSILKEEMEQIGILREKLSKLLKEEE